MPSNGYFFLRRALAPQRRPQLESREGPREAGRVASVIAQDDGLPGRMASIARNASGPLLDRDRLRRLRRWRDVFFRSPDEGGCVRIPAELLLLSSPTSLQPGKFNISVTREPKSRITACVTLGQKNVIVGDGVGLRPTSRPAMGETGLFWGRSRGFNQNTDNPWRPSTVRQTRHARGNLREQLRRRRRRETSLWCGVRE